jgi:hypothetical protein
MSQRDPLILELGRVLAAGEFGDRSSSSADADASGKAEDAAAAAAAAAALARTGLAGLDGDADADGAAGLGLSGSRQQRWTCRYVEPAADVAVDEHHEQWIWFCMRFVCERSALHARAKLLGI